MTSLDHPEVWSMPREWTLKASQRQARKSDRTHERLAILYLKFYVPIHRAFSCSGPHKDCCELKATGFSTVKYNSINNCFNWTKTWCAPSTLLHSCRSFLQVHSLCLCLASVYFILLEEFWLVASYIQWIHYASVVPCRDSWVIFFCVSGVALLHKGLARTGSKMICRL